MTWDVKNDIVAIEKCHVSQLVNPLTSLQLSVSNVKSVSYLAYYKVALVTDNVVNFMLILKDIVGPLISLFWTSGDIYHVFQSAVQIALTFSDLLLGQKMLTLWRSVWQPSLFNSRTCRTCVRIHCWEFEPMTMHTAAQCCEQFGHYGLALIMSFVSANLSIIATNLWNTFC